MSPWHEAHAEDAARYAMSLARQGSQYSDQTRREVALAYLIHGNVAKVAKSVGVSETTIPFLKEAPRRRRRTG